MFDPKNLHLPLCLLLVCLISACQTPMTAPPMPPSPDDVETTETVTEEPAALDYVLKAGNHETSLEELRAGDINTKWVITVITDPASVEYSRTLELLDEISRLGYQVRYQPAASTP